VSEGPAGCVGLVGAADRAPVSGTPAPDIPGLSCTRAAGSACASWSARAPILTLPAWWHACVFFPGFLLLGGAQSVREIVITAHHEGGFALW